KAVRIRVPAHDVVTAGQRQPVVVTNVVAAGEVNQPGKSLGDQLPESRAAAFVRAIRDDQVGLASLTKDFHECFLRLDIVPADKAIPCPMSEEGGFGIIVTQSFVRRVDLQNKPHLRMTLLERLNDLDRPVLRGIVYYDNLEAYPSLAAGCYHCLQRLLDVRLLVIASDEDGQLDFFFCHRAT